MTLPPKSRSTTICPTSPSSARLSSSSLIKSSSDASSAGRWVLAPHDEAAAEQEWSSRDLLPGAAAAHQRGFERGAVNHVIDRIFIAAGCRWIIDYKTVHVPGEAVAEPFLQARAEEYRGQLERYAKLFAGSDLPLRMAVFFPLQGILVELPHA